MLYERNDEYPIMVSISLATLTQSAIHTISMLNEKVMEVESENQN